MKKSIGILVILGMMSFGFWFLSSSKKPKPEGPLCLEITEINRDTFKNELFMEEPGFQQNKRFDLKDPKAKLFLIYHLVYEGAGRESRQEDYHSFPSFPANLPLPSFSEWSDKFHLALGDSIGRTLEIRLSPAKGLRIDEAAEGAVKISVEGKEALISSGEEQTLWKNSKTMSVTQDAFGPVPKGPITEKEIHVDTVAYGDIIFSTELKVKNLGPCDGAPPSMFQRP